MTAFHLTLDPPAVATGRVELDLNSGPIRIGGTSPGTSIDWGDAAITQALADQTWGSSPVDFRVPNRNVKIPLFLGCGAFASAPAAILAEEQARALLQQKVALLQREGGWLLRQRTNGPAMYADIINATLTLPDVWGETGGVEADVTLVLECLPDFYGDEITLDTIAASGTCVAVLKASGAQAVIKGDYPARCRIVVTTAAGSDQRGSVWGMRSRHYDPAATASLFRAAGDLTPLDATATFAHGGATSGQTLRHNSLPAGSWCPVLLTDIRPGVIGVGSAALTHQGSYRVWVRVYSATATPQLRLLWGVADVAHPVTNDAVQVPGAADFYLVDLGGIRLDAPPVGGFDWHGVIQALAAVQGDPVEIDCLYFQPLDESSGKLVAQQGLSPFGIEKLLLAGAGADDGSVGTVAWSNPSNITKEDAAVAASGPGAGTSHYLKASTFGFAIPTGATISGIQVDIKRTNNDPSGPSSVVDNRVRLVKAGTIQTPDKADVNTPWSSSLAFKSYGGPTDLWGGAWAPADINAAGFGAAISAISAGASALAQIDAIRITIFYTTVGSFTTSADAVCYANASAEFRTEGMFRQGLNDQTEGVVAVVMGDLPRLPPSGIEGRAVELLVKMSRGDLHHQSDGGLDVFSAQVKYRPSYLSRP